ncbi:retrovirus-related pol polyprotein from transposon TNT 1-94 [Tanacetum coccineum]|uniref:Retrovirus-related pol polyprotein from transposon TNT 1-94 n=1 Tax=Tanacetum coccineum TaxID=301880 RepID=A0ABQ5AW86_9ASTR
MEIGSIYRKLSLDEGYVKKLEMATKPRILLTYEVQGIRLGKIGLSATNHQDTIKVGKHDSKSVTRGLLGKGETSNSSKEYSKHWKKEVINEQYPDVIDIAGMDYTPARKKSPIHN